MTCLVIQTISSIAFFVFIVIGINLLPDKKRYNNHPKLFKTLAISNFILATLTAIYFIYDIFFLNFVALDCSIIKLIFFTVAIILFAIFTFISRDETRFQGLIALALIFMFVPLMALFIGSMELYEIEHKQQIIYNQKVIVQKPKVVTEKYEILSLNDNTNVEGNFSGDIGGSLYGRFFVMRGSLEGTQNGEIKNVDVYKFYYIADSKTRKIFPKTLYAEQTPIYPIQEGETPYLLKITSTPYSLDYNVNPAKECNFKESIVTYELHIPETAIINQFVLDSK